MRISDWSSDVCSSDLHAQGPLALPRPPATLSRRRRRRPVRVRMTASTGKTVIVATDGACKGNPGPGGWGAVLRWGDVVKTLSGGEPDTTNNRMELMAAIEALAALKRSYNVELTTDSVSVRDGITKDRKNTRLNTRQYCATPRP